MNYCEFNYVGETMCVCRAPFLVLFLLEDCHLTSWWLFNILLYINSIICNIIVIYNDRFKRAMKDNFFGKGPITFVNEWKKRVNRIVPHYSCYLLMAKPNLISSAFCSTRERIIIHVSVFWSTNYYHSEIRCSQRKEKCEIYFVNIEGITVVVDCFSIVKWKSIDKKLTIPMEFLYIYICIYKIFLLNYHITACCSINVSRFSDYCLNTFKSRYFIIF